MTLHHLLYGVCLQWGVGAKCYREPGGPGSGENLPQAWSWRLKQAEGHGVQVWGWGTGSLWAELSVRRNTRGPGTEHRPHRQEAGQACVQGSWPGIQTRGGWAARQSVEGRGDPGPKPTVPPLALTLTSLYALGRGCGDSFSIF